MVHFMILQMSSFLGRTIHFQGEDTKKVLEL